MVGKAGHDESRESWVCRGPDGMVKAELLQSKYPNCKASGWTRRSCLHPRQATRQEHENSTRGSPDPSGMGWQKNATNERETSRVL